MALQALRRRRWILILAGAPVVIGLILAVLFVYRAAELRREEAAEKPSPEAPPDLLKLREPFLAGMQAVQNGEPAEAIRHLRGFSFGGRAVEEYRLYYLWEAYKAAGQPAAARATLARLWNSSPRLVHASETGLELARAQAEEGAWADAARTLVMVASSPATPVPVEGNARWREIEARMVTGDIGGAYDAARRIITKTPRVDEVGPAIAVMRSLRGIPADQPVPLTAAERLERAVGLMRDGDPANAYTELTALAGQAPPSLRLPIQLNRGLALHHMRRYESSTEVLEPLTSSYYKYAIPALYHLARNYRVMSDAIDPTVLKTVKERKRVGSVKVRVGKGKKRRTVTKPKYGTVTRTVKQVDLAKKNQKETYNRLATERLKDILQLPAAPPVRSEVLNTLIAGATAKGQDDYAMQLVRDAVKIDPIFDPALQYFWDKGWAAYVRGDLPTARGILRFIADTYTHPNIRRQSEYWYARTIGRLGQEEEAAAIYQQLASAPYDDLYALHAVQRGARKVAKPPRPLRKEGGSEWHAMAERHMPQELRLAYELTALSAYREARLEIQRNADAGNRRWADALLADFYNHTNNRILMYRSIRRAFPQLATVEQDQVPDYFLRMYYPMRFHEDIRRFAERNDLDPYLVMGLVLQESYYNPLARSPVGATGLMQIMPPTGKEIAGKLRIPFATARLEDPQINLQLGTYYLRSLIRLFDGNAYLAVASYNAGQGNVMRWQRANRNRSMDEFLESIPFQETRNYVKRVMMLRSAYSRIAA